MLNEAVLQIKQFPEILANDVESAKGLSLVESCRDALDKRWS